MFKKIIDSVYNPSFYSELKDKPLSYSLKYFLGLVSIIALLFTILISIKAMPVANQLINKYGPSTIASYPQDLVVTVKNGQASTNSNSPTIIPMPGVLTSDVKKGGMATIKNLLVIDTTIEPTLENFKKSQTALLLTKNVVMTFDNNSSIKIQQLTPGMDVVINKDKVNMWGSKLLSLAQILYPIIFVGLFIGYLIFSLLYLLPLFVIALVLWLVLAITKKSDGYLKSYQYTVHASTITFLLSIILLLINTFISGPGNISFLFNSLIIVIVATVNLLTAK